MVSGLLGISTSDIFKRESTFWINKNTNEYFECPLVEFPFGNEKVLNFTSIGQGVFIEFFS